MTTTMAATRTERTRRAILQAADACFREVGFDAAKSTEIARRAGVAEGTVFLHYGSKSGLLTAVTKDFYDLIQAEAEKEFEAPGDAATRLRRLVDGWASRLETDWSLISVFAQRSLAEPDSELSQTMLVLNRRYTRLVLAVIKELQAQGVLPSDIPPVVIRDIIFGTLEHTARGQSNTGRPLRVRGAGQQILDILLLESAHDGECVGDIDAKLDEILRRLPPA
jgi:AcrR family transcriptional regulator